MGHEGPGLDDIQRHRASDVAALGYVGFALGYVGFALDYHGSLSPFADRGAMMGRLGEFFANPERNRVLGVAALVVVRREPSVDSTRIAAIGFCFGATVALELARTGADISAVVGFHPGLTNISPTTAETSWARCCCASAWTARWSRSNTGLPGIAYGERAVRQSWNAMRELFAEVF